MSEKPFTAFLLVAAGSGMNAAAAVQNGHTPFPTILGGIVFGAICVAINDVGGGGLGTMLAAIFLLGSALTSGVRFIDSLTTAVEAYGKDR